jgi:hypothetical protein
LFEVIEAEQLLPVPIEMARDVDGASQRESKGVVAVLRPLDGVPVIEEIVCVEILVAEIVVARAMKFRPAGAAQMVTTVPPLPAYSAR